MIANPTPVTAATFAGMWITNLGIFLPTAEKPKGFIGGNFSPYDGQHLLATGGKRLFVGELATKLTTDAVLAGVLSSLVAECKRQAEVTTDIKFINVMAPDPTKPVRAQIMLEDNSHHTIDDCFALAGTDPVFAGVLMGTMAEMARQAGLSVA